MASAVAAGPVGPDTSRLTPEQHAAVYTRNVSISLSAGAGCGKTFVLTERFLSHLDPADPTSPEPAQLGELIAITFTERAAREMRDRIRQKCFERLQSADAEHADYWLSLLRSLDAARVSTIHSFCASLLRSHAVEAGLDPAFAVLDQTQADTLLTETIEDGLREHLVAKDELTISLVVHFGLERLHGMLATLLSKTSEIDFAAWEQETAQSLVARWQKYHREVFQPARLRQIAESPQATELLRILKDNTPSHAAMAQRRQLLLDKLPKLARSKDPSGDLHAIRESAMVKGGGGKSAWDSDEIYEAFKDAAERLRKCVDGCLESLDFNRECALLDAQAGLDLLRLASKIASKYEQKKRELASLDFSDLMTRARRLLCSSEGNDLRKSLAAQVRLLLVDEFQDTDPGQVELVRALCGDDVRSGKLFFVGDRKQSIYRFRGAQPQVFHRLREEIPPKGQLPLNLNFRSQPAILDFVNALFVDEFRDDAESMLLRAHRKQVSPKPAIEFLWAPEESNRMERGASERARRREARWIARRIRAMIDSNEPLVGEKDGNTRPVKPGDIAILFRALSDVAYYEQALQEYGVHYYLVGGHAFYAQQEIYDVLNLLRSLASTCDEVSLAGVLRSPFFSLSDETLFWLVDHGDTLSAGLFGESLPPQLDGEQRRRAAFAAQTLTELRARKDRTPICELLNEALARTGYDAILLAEFLGERKLANLRKLIGQARNFQRSGMFTLADFIVQLSQFVVKQPHEALAATHPENTDVVRLMSVHQSKGLEFPVVVVPDLDRQSYRMSGSAEFTPELGPLVRVPTATGDRPPGCCGFDLHATIAAEEDQAEMSRLFYVAATRAADRLILSSPIFNFDAPVGPWLKLLASRFDLKSGRFVHEVPAGCDTPEVTVSTEPPETQARPSSGGGRTDLRKIAARAARGAEQGKIKPAPLAAPIAPDDAARRRYSFSRLTGSLQRDDVTAEVADTASRSRITPGADPLQFGLLAHAVLAEPDLSSANLEQSVRRHAEAQMPDADDKSVAEMVELVRNFVGSKRSAELAQARYVHREVEFLLAWPPDGKAAVDLYLHGYIDCLFQDETGRWHLLDYKTNRVSKANVVERAQPYELQMYVYALAAETVLGQPPASLTLHFLRTGAEHQFAWDEAARERAVDLVNQALAQAVRKS